MLFIFFILVFCFLCSLIAFYLINKNRDTVYTKIKKENIVLIKEEKDHDEFLIENKRKEEIYAEIKQIKIEENLAEEKNLYSEIIESTTTADVSPEEYIITSDLSSLKSTPKTDLSPIESIHSADLSPIESKEKEFISACSTDKPKEDEEDEELSLKLDDLIDEFIKYIKNKKMVKIDDLSAKMNTNTSDTLLKLRELEIQGQSFGFLDKVTGKYITINEKELDLLNKIYFGRKNKKIKKSELINEFNSIIGPSTYS